MIILRIIHLVDGQKIVKHALYNYPVPILTSLIFFLHPTNSPKNFNQCMTTANSSIREAGRSKLCSYLILSNPFYLMTHHWHRQRCYVTQVMFLYIYTHYTFFCSIPLQILSCLPVSVKINQAWNEVVQIKVWRATYPSLI